MTIRDDIQRLREMDWDLTHWLRLGARLCVRALVRLWGRDVMLYVGGTSFFVMLAAFPALALLVGIYGLLADPAHAAATAEALARLMPTGAHEIFTQELMRLTYAPPRAVSAQSALALIIGGYASHRGFKALLAGLSFIHDEVKPRGFVGFNVLALLVLIAAFAMMAVVSGIFLGLRLLNATFALKPLAGVGWLYSEWTWASVGLTLGMSLIYRFAMSSRPVAWRASLIGGVSAAILCLFASWASAFYVEQIVELGATYGSLSAVVVLLIWLSWSVNAVFFGGALATEVELLMGRGQRQLLADLRGEKPMVSPPGS